MVRRLSERNTITIPKDILKRIGLKPGDYFEITDDGNRIILTPKIVEDKFTDEEWEKLEKLARERGRVYKTATEAKKHLEGLAW
ncbi:MAG: AbrB/MazE/SpoVT family DNA-binding domain-containing protein [Actinomycetota bacterium]